MIIYVLLAAATVLTIVIWARLRTAFRLFHLPQMPPDTSAKEDSLPSVSLCIPARDETHAMTNCLEEALLSRYPKLEIIVLDDGSRDNTSNLIKSFAHSGVRFVEGSKLPHGWLGKNHALEGLLREASGTYILFADVDTRLSQNSISQMVEYVQANDVDMLSVLPLRHKANRASALLATLRHFWNIVGHTVSSPAVASNAWMIKRSIMTETFNGFRNVAMDVRPEKAIARKVGKDGRYRFVISTPQLGVWYEKKLSSQFETAQRIYYPDFGLSGVVLRIVGLLCMLSPYVLVVVTLAQLAIIPAFLSVIIVILISLLNNWYLGVLRTNTSWMAAVILPYILVREMYLLAASVYVYKRGVIVWKGRPVRLDR
ncbi:hypothetical protein A2707_01110 [Candidatus Saccharibacteria bacterium RIFCSPHIGHO2_01_FULL_45_15]|nr:MAG: hypothetical protein A2707_01110 [Candidatus Saccharibacteria bacterium RIFCSPHIGHO2_01_FULL_45_15]OGL26970.1 MAG: hypothetical protein A3C39_02225 [Candidatus Saccharibacteria bacterium RIFCSPHIGHO2_02_FULL_46_12]OGL32928.1 MAG: hypothetical protein A3E76_06220 [Candidatus Saccharibacteria bacterium RIFCSPHIGHO2_12_FULL_44_22]